MDKTDLRLRLLENGYTPLMNLDKVTRLTGWQTLDVTPEVIARWGRSRGFDATGLRLDHGLAALDFDVNHPAALDLYAALETAFPDLLACPARGTTASPKEAWFFRTPEPFGRVFTPTFVDGDEGLTVEIFGGASPRQFGAFGPHDLEKGSEYVWRDDVSPATVPLSELPMLSKERVYAIRDFCTAWLAERFEARDGSAGGENEREAIYDLTDDMVFVLHDGGTANLAELRAVAASSTGYTYCSASFIDGPIAKNTRRCAVSLGPDGGVQVWDSMTDYTHHEAALAPRTDESFLRIAHAMEAIGMAPTAAAAAATGDPVGADADEARLLGQLQFEGGRANRYALNNLHNATIVARTGFLRDAFAYDEFMNGVTALRDVPEAGVPAGRRLDHNDWSGLIAAVQSDFAYRKLLPNTVKQGVAFVAHRDHRTNVMRDWLDGLAWDGVSRMEDLVGRALGAVVDTYSVEVVTRWLVQAIDRALRPGCQADHTLILIGTKQGEAKSEFFRNLPPDPDLALELKGSDARNADRIAYRLAGKWIVDFAELSALKGRDSEETKAFLTMRTDSAYILYQGAFADQPRTCVFGGTTNESHFLSDPTGNRRYWPVEVAVRGPMDREWLVANRDQVWAEARALHAAGKRSYIGRDEPELEALVERHQRERMIQSPDIGRVADFLRKYVPDHCSTREIYNAVFTEPGSAQRSRPIPRKDIHEIRDTMLSLGWAQTKKIDGIAMWTRTERAGSGTHFLRVVNTPDAATEGRTASERAVARDLSVVERD